MSTRPEKVALHESDSLPPNYDDSQSTAFGQQPLAYSQPQYGPAQPYGAQGGGPPQPYGGPTQQYVTQGGAPTQPYMAQTYIQPAGQPMQPYGQPQTTIQMTNIGQPSSFQVVPQIAMESQSTKQLNKASAILAGVLFGFTVLGLILGPVVASGRHYLVGIFVAIASIMGGIGLLLLLIPMVLSCVVAFSKQGNKRGMLIGAIVMYCLAAVTANWRTMYRYTAIDASIIGSIGGLFFLIGMVLSCVVSFSKEDNKRGMLIGAIVLYCISVCLLLSWAGFAVLIGPWMLLFLVVGFGCLALAIMSGIACSRYNENMIVVLGNAPYPVVIGSAPQPVMGNVGQPVMGNVAQPMMVGNVQQPVMSNAPQTGQPVYNPGQQPMPYAPMGNAPAVATGNAPHAPQVPMGNAPLVDMNAP